MSMQIAEKHTASLFIDLHDELLYWVHGWVEKFWGIFPLSIEVTASKGTSIVTVDHTVRVQHRNNLEYEIVSQKLRLFIFGIRQKEQQTTHHPATYSFAGMHPCRYHNSLASRVLLDITLCGNRQKFTIFSGQRATEYFSGHIVSPLLISLNLWEIFAQIRVRIRHTVSEEDFILIMLESILESQCVIMFTEYVVGLLPDLTLKVLNIIAISMPACIVKLLTFFRVYWHFHTKVKQRIWLRVVEDVEFDCFARSRIHHSKIKPLGVALSIDIILHPQIVFKLAQFLG